MVTAVSRPINGISLNGDEWLLKPNSSELMTFPSVEDAKKFLLTEGVLEEELEFFNFHEEAN